MCLPRTSRAQPCVVALEELILLDKTDVSSPITRLETPVTFHCILSGTPHSNKEGGSVLGDTQKPCMGRGLAGA